MRICLVDDESTQLDYLKLIIEKWANKNNRDLTLHFYHSAEEMLFESNESFPFDMILLDIQMGKMNGIDLAKKIRETDKKVIIALKLLEIAYQLYLRNDTLIYRSYFNTDQVSVHKREY